MSGLSSPMWCSQAAVHPSPDSERADLVTEMSLVKHPFREQGVKAQLGIEF